MSKFDKSIMAELIAALTEIKARFADSSQEIFNHIRDEITFHKLEAEFGIKAERILDAISRASDLTKRGVRGVIAETVFATDIAPHIEGWVASDPVGDMPYDVLMTKGYLNVRIQVKMQRKEKGIPKMIPLKRGGKIRDHYVVEVQRTRNGVNDIGEATRPYRFGEFDLLAVCMEPSTKSWHDFQYTPEKLLRPRANEPALIDIMQPIPPLGKSTNLFESPIAENWTSDLLTALERLS